VGGLRVENNQIVSTYSSLINPQTHLPPEIISLTGIQPQALELAPTFNQIKHDLYEFLDGAIFTAHNSSFDYGFIRTEFKRHGLNYSHRHLCTVKLSRRLFPAERHHNLDAVIQRAVLPALPATALWVMQKSFALLATSPHPLRPSNHPNCPQRLAQIPLTPPGNFQTNGQVPPRSSGCLPFLRSGPLPPLCG